MTKSWKFYLVTGKKGSDFIIKKKTRQQQQKNNYEFHLSKMKRNEYMYIIANYQLKNGTVDEI